MTPWQLVRTWLHLYFVGVRRRMVLGARVVVFDGDKVLLIRHTYAPGWHFPGGGVEPGEVAEQSARREVLEEAGVETVGPLRLFGLYLNAHAATNRDHVALFVCRDFRVVREFKPNAEIAEIGWFPAEALPAEAEPGAARRIAEILSNDTPAPRW